MSSLLCALGKNILALRTALGLSQAQLAKLAKISQAHVSDIEKGKRWPSEEIVLRIASALEVYPPGKLFMVPSKKDGKAERRSRD